jgi:hypothetical protein
MSSLSWRTSVRGCACRARTHQGLAAFGLEKVDLLRVDGNAPPILGVQQDAVFENHHEPSVRLPVVSAVKRGLGRLNGRFSGWAANWFCKAVPGTII